MSTGLFSLALALADGGLGVVGADGSAATGHIGTAGSGTVDEVYPFAGDTSAIIATLGAGDMPDWVGYFLEQSLGKTSYSVRGAGSTAGTAGVATLLSGTGPTVPTFAGAPNEDARFRARIIATGSATTATWQPSFDGGATWGDTRTAGTTLALGNGATITFPVGTYTAGAIFGSTFTGPRNSLSDIASAADALIESPFRMARIHVLGYPANAADLFTLAAALDAKAEAAVAVGKMLDFVLEAPPVDPALLVTEAAGFVGKNVVICGGFADIFDSNDRRVEKVSTARAIVPRLGRNPMSVSAMRDATDTVVQAALARAAAIWPSTALKTGADGYIDSSKLPGLDTARFSTMQTIPGRGGSYVANVFTMAGLTSDFSWYPNKAVANRGREVLFDLLWDRAQQRVPRDPTTGNMSAAYASALEGAINGALNSALVDGGHATGVKAVVDRTSTSQLKVSARAVPVDHARSASVEFGLTTAIAA